MATSRRRPTPEVSLQRWTNPFKYRHSAAKVIVGILLQTVPSYVRKARYSRNIDRNHFSMVRTAVSFRLPIPAILPWPGPRLASRPHGRGHCRDESPPSVAKRSGDRLPRGHGGWKESKRARPDYEAEPVTSTQKRMA